MTTATATAGSVISENSQGESMSTLDEDISELAKAAGVDLVGFTDKERLADAPPSGDLTYTLPNAESAIGLAVALDREAVRKYMAKEDMWALNHDHRNTYRSLKQAGIAIESYLLEQGFDVAVPYANFEYRPDTSPEQMAPPLSHKYVCTAAGVGWIGWSGNLLTAEYGALVTIGSIVTNAKLAPSPMVEQDWCTDCNFCVATCPTNYMPKKEADLIQIGDKPASYSHRRTAIRCTVSCGGANGIRKPHSPWSTWSSRELTDMPGADKSDEAFAERCEEIVAEQPQNRRLKYMLNLGQHSATSWDDYDRIVDELELTCSMCQMVCVPGVEKRREHFSLLVNSGRIERGDPRLIEPHSTR
jgi:epoxyqueuosine reductase